MTIERRGFVFARDRRRIEELSHLLYRMENKGIEVLSILQFRKEYDVLAELFQQDLLNEFEIVLRRPNYPIFEPGDIIIYIKEKEGLDLTDKDMPFYLFGEDKGIGVYYLNASLYEKAEFFTLENDCLYVQLLQSDKLSS